MRSPVPCRDSFDGWGFEYKSQATLLGLPWLHISFKFRPNRLPVPARGVIAIGQFTCGIFTLSQFGVGIVSLRKFTVAVAAVAQFGIAYSLIAQMGLYLHDGRGQLVRSVFELFGG